MTAICRPLPGWRFHLENNTLLSQQHNNRLKESVANIPSLKGPIINQRAKFSSVFSIHRQSRQVVHIRSHYRIAEAGYCVSDDARDVRHGLGSGISTFSNPVECSSVDLKEGSSPLLRRGVRKWLKGRCKASVRTEYVQNVSADDEPPAERQAESEGQIVEEESREKSLLRAAGIVGLATVGSKILGVLREGTLAAAFGVGPVMNAYSYASILPAFLMSMLGGINGPFHSGIASALATQTPEAGRELVESVSTLLLGVFTLASVAIFFAAPALVDAAAPGLLTSANEAVTSAAPGLLTSASEAVTSAATTRAIAVAQLRVMSPVALLAALLGVGFGSLNAAGVYALPSLSPALSSGAIIASVAFHVWRSGGAAAALGPQSAMAGGVAIAGGYLAGALLQWVAQATTQIRLGLTTLRLRWANPLTDPGLRKVLRVMVPGALGSGMLQIATYTDLYFASFIPGAAAALGYANLLVQSPLGILSSALLVPILQLFAKSAAPAQWPDLRRRIRQGVLFAAAVTLPLTAVMIPLATPVVRVLLQRKAFDTAATLQVAPLVVAYQLGAIAFLIRDVLVRVFYALGDGGTTAYVSIAAILLNVVLDWVAVRKFGLGAQGLILATLSVNVASGVIFLAILERRIGDLRIREWVRPLLTMASAAVVSAYATVLSHAATHRGFTFLFPLITPPALLPKVAWFAEFSACGCAFFFSLATFVAVLVWARLPEADAISSKLRKKLKLPT